ncbi:NAD(P)-dependent oxidoreductase [Blastococcus sp. TF02A-26]|uniref:NAD-dependent epimerase/dehydratase family protein n=1 Tax=Blastococcus sp. TF02A-26 TaxID=2250577 RepID=UPI0013146C15|nr:NAD(P)-dependent oxidoreductase [Blastococcus sp. TF02A-26]
MSVLVTGAGGFLGRRVVAALRDRGLTARALVRRPDDDLAAMGAEVVVGDLRRPVSPALFDGVETVVHLAAVVAGSPGAQFTGTVTATEHLLAAMAGSGVSRLVLCSSFSVYDWSEVSGSLDEDSPLEADLHTRDGYTAAKLWQERVCRRAAVGAPWTLTVLRPGFVWGPGNDWVWGVGVRARDTTVVVGSRKPLPLTHVDNCADAFATVVCDPRADGGTYNVVDGFPITPLDYAKLYRAGYGGRIVVVPHAALRGVGVAAAGVIRALSGRPARLPALFDTHLFDARFKPLSFPPSRLTSTVGWRPPHTLAECAARTFGSGALPSGGRGERAATGTVEPAG